MSKNKTKINKNTNIINIHSMEDIPDEVKILASEHYEPRILEKLLGCSKTHDYCSGVCEELCVNKRFQLITNRQFGEINAFALIHTEWDTDRKNFGWIDFVMVRRENRADGLGSSLTELAIGLLQEKNVANISTTILFPIGIEGESGYPNYGSTEQLLIWGFKPLGQHRYRYIQMDDYRYKQEIYILH